MSRTRIALLAAALAALGSGCGAIADKAAETATERVIESSTDGEVDIQRDGDGFSIETEDGSMSVDDKGNMVIETDEGTATIDTSEDLPDGFPDIPLPDDLVVESASRFADAEGTVVYSVAARVGRDAAEVFDEQLTSMEEAGYSIDYRSDSKSAGEFFGTAIVSKGDGNQVNFNVITDDDAAIVQLSVTSTEG